MKTELILGFGLLLAVTIGAPLRADVSPIPCTEPVQDAKPIAPALLAIIPTLSGYQAIIDKALRTEIIDEQDLYWVLDDEYGRALFRVRGTANPGLLPGMGGTKPPGWLDAKVRPVLARIGAKEDPLGRGFGHFAWGLARHKGVYFLIHYADHPWTTTPQGQKVSGGGQIWLGIEAYRVDPGLSARAERVTN